MFHPASDMETEDIRQPTAQIVSVSIKSLPQRYHLALVPQTENQDENHTLSHCLYRGYCFETKLWGSFRTISYAIKSAISEYRYEVRL
jgi:hypothetical protein